MISVHVRFLRYSAFYTPLLLTLESDDLRREGFVTTFDKVEPGRTIEDGFRQGTIQVAQSAPAVSFRSALAGHAPAYRHFAVMNVRDGFFLAARDASSLFDWRSLEGKTVLVDHFFQPFALFQTALRRRGVDISKVEIVDAGSVAEIEAAFRAGKGDFVHLQGPAPQQLEQEGLARVVASIGEAAGPLAFSSLAASPAWLETSEAKVFMRAFRRARAVCRVTPPAELAKRVAPYLEGVGLPALTETLRAYQALGTWEGDEAITRELFEETADKFIQVGYIASRPSMTDVFAAPPA